MEIGVPLKTPDMKKMQGCGRHTREKSGEARRNRAIVIAVLLPVGGNRTHVRVPKDILTMISLYHSSIEVLIEFDSTDTCSHTVQRYSMIDID